MVNVPSVPGSHPSGNSAPVSAVLEGVPVWGNFAKKPPNPCFTVNNSTPDLAPQRAFDAPPPMNPDPDLATLTVWQNNRQNVASYLNSTACSNYFNNNAQLKDLYPLLKSAIAGNTDTFWDGSRSTISTYDAGFWGPDDTEAEKTTMKTYTVCRTMIGGSGIAASTDIHGPNIYVNPYYRNHHYSDGYNPFNQSTLLHETLHTLGKTDCDLQKAMGDTCDRSNTTGISKHLLTAGCSAN